MANTIIFVLSGVIIAGRIYNSELATGTLIEPADYGYAFLLWVYLNVRPGVAFPIPSGPTSGLKHSPVL